MTTLPIVVPDIHGHPKLLDWVERQFAHRPLVLLGDLIHRGPDSRACLQRALDWAEAGRATLLWGNHEAWVYDDLCIMRMPERAWKQKDPELWENYQRHGGFREVVRDMERFASFAQPYCVVGDMLCAHAARPELGATPAEVIGSGHLWDMPGDERQPLPTQFFPEVRYSVHGHTVMPQPVVELQEYKLVYLDLGGGSLERFCVWDVLHKQVIRGTDL